MFFIFSQETEHTDTFKSLLPILKAGFERVLSFGDLAKKTDIGFLYKPDPIVFEFLSNEERLYVEFSKEFFESSFFSRKPAYSKEVFNHIVFDESQRDELIRSCKLALSVYSSIPQNDSIVSLTSDKLKLLTDGVMVAPIKPHSGDDYE